MRPSRKRGMKAARRPLPCFHGLHDPVGRKIVDQESRAVRKIMENQLEEPKRQAYDKIARAKFAVEGTSAYPDATFTLRLAFGTVKGYEEDGKKIPLRNDLHRPL